MSKSSNIFHHVASAPSIMNDCVMMSEDDSTSRDSGFSEMMDENTPMCFSSLHGEITRFKELESMDTTELAPAPVNVGRKRIPLKREKSQRRLFDAPSSSSTPVAPRQDLVAALKQRCENEQGGELDAIQRKRFLGVGGDEEYSKKKKKERRNDSYSHYRLNDSFVEEDGDSLQGPPEEEAPTEDLPPSNAFLKPFSPYRSRNKGLKSHRDQNQSKTTSIVMEVETMNEGEEEEDDEDDEEAIDPSNPGFKVKYHLETIECRNSTCFRRISSFTLISLVSSLTEEQFNEKYILVDCRYPFEYEGGHVKHATNFYNPEEVATLFYDEQRKQAHKRVPIFYCEYSQKRGPSMAHALRKLDREINVWPSVSFPEIYVLDKGYKQFFLTYSSENRNLWEKRFELPERHEVCVPDNYMTMLNPGYADVLKDFSFHKRGNPGQSVFRFKSAPADLAVEHTSNTTTTTLEPTAEESTSMEVEEGRISPENQEQTHVMTVTPFVRRTGHCQRSLFMGNTDSPTSLNRLLPLRAARTDQPPSPPLPMTPVGQLEFDESRTEEPTTPEEEPSS